jgi:hypothetical protein
MAGLLAGRVLADHFDRVTIVERDRFPTAAPAPRRGVPQAQHLHILLMRGQAIVERLFPGLRDELVADGAPLVDSAGDFLWRNPAGWALRYRSGLTKLAFTRDLLDWRVRHRLAAFERVRFMEATDVTGLLPGPDGGVRGVLARSEAGDAPLEADLVVDASGRGSRAPGWLAALGYPVPEESLVDAHLGYASRLYRPPAAFRSDWRAGITALPWTLATSEDSRYHGTEGARLDGRTRLMHRYMDQVLALTTRSRAARRTLLEVQHMLRPPTALFRPGMLARVLGGLAAARERPRLGSDDRRTAAAEASGLG